MESINVEVRTKKPKSREQMFKEIQKEIAQQIFPFSDMQFKPVSADLASYGNMSKKQKKIFAVQYQLFGKDLLQDQEKRFESINSRGNIAESLAKARSLRNFTSELINAPTDLLVDNEVSNQLDKIQKDNASNQDLAFLNRLLIKKDSTWKGAFDIIMLVVSCYNVFGNAFYAAFGMPHLVWLQIFDNFVEVLFLIDLFCCFCEEYMDEETFTDVSEVKTIAIHYLKSSFIFDVLAILPFEYIFPTSVKPPSRLWRLMKLLRIPRLSKLQDVEKFKGIVNEYYQKQLEHNIARNDETPYPIMYVLTIVQFYKIFQLVLLIFACSYFLGILWHIYTKDLSGWETHATIDVYNQLDTFYILDKYKL